jgi:hypothetical protein
LGAAYDNVAKRSKLLHTVEELGEAGSEATSSRLLRDVDLCCDPHDILCTWGRLKGLCSLIPELYFLVVRKACLELRNSLSQSYLRLQVAGDG